MVNSRTTSDDPSVLLAQAGWVHVLARRLVAEPAGAEDVAQETLLRALELPPMGGRSPNSLRAWLGSVASNLARSRGRSEGHRLLREERAAQPESSPSTAEVVARADTLRQVVEAVLALDEPARSTVLWSYFDGESAVEIARRTGASPAAVRKRLSRALASLRVTLDASHGGDGQSWCTALLSLTSGAAQGARMTGAMAMGTQAKVVAAVITLGLGGILWRMSDPADPSSTPVVKPEAAGATIDEGAEVLSELGSPAEIDAPRTDVARASAWGRLRAVHAGTYERLAGVVALSAEASTWEELRSKVSEQWIALGVQTRAERWLALAGEEAVPPDPDTPDVAPFAPRAEQVLGTSDADGVITIIDEPLADRWLVLRHPDFFPLVLAPAAMAEFAGTRREVALAPRGELSVRLIDTTGVPIPGAFLRAERDFDELFPVDLATPLLDSLRWHGPTDEDGRLTIGDLPCGAHLVVTPLGEFKPRSASAYLDAESCKGALEIRVQLLGSIVGRVVDPEGGPVPGKRVGFSEGTALVLPGGGWEETDSTGAFRLDNLPAGVGQLKIVGATYFPEQAVEVRVPAGDVLDVGSIELPRVARISGRVVGLPPGEPSGVGLVLLQGGETRWMNSFLSADGSFEIDVPEGEYVLSVSRACEWAQEFSLARVPVTCPSKDLEISVAGRLGGIAGTVETSLPAGATVLCRCTPAKQQDVRKDGAVVSRDVPVRGGRFELGTIPPGRWSVILEFGSHGTAFVPDVEVRSGQVTELGPVSIGPATLHGQLADESGAVFAAASVRLVAPKLDMWAQGPSRVTHEVRAEDDGSYRFEGLDAGRWTLLALGDFGETSLPVTVELSAGQAVQQDLQLLTPRTVRGRVTRGGEPVAGMEVTWSYAELFAPKLRLPGGARVVTDDGGDYSLGPFVPGGYTIHLPEAGLSRPVQLAQTPDTRVDFELDGAKIRVRLEQGGAPFLDATRLRVTGLDPGADAVGGSARGRPLGEGVWEVPDLGGQMLLTISVVTSSTYGGELYALLERESNGEAVVRLDTGEVQVLVPEVHRDHVRPRLSLVSVGGVTISDIQPYELPLWIEEPEPGHLRWQSVPAGAEVCLKGLDVDGRPFERTFVYPGGAPLLVEWP